MNRVTRIEQLLGEGLIVADNIIELQHLEVVDESANHSGPADAQSHFKVVLVASQFSHISRIDRHRAINQCLQSEFDSGMHALAIHAYDEQQWQIQFGKVPLSPPCASMGASGNTSGEYVSGEVSAGPSVE